MSRALVLWAGAAVLVVIAAFAVLTPPGSGLAGDDAPVLATVLRGLAPMLVLLVAGYAIVRSMRGPDDR